MEEPPKNKFEELGNAMNKKRKMARCSKNSDGESPVPDSDDKTTTAGGNETIHEFSTAAGYLGSITKKGMLKHWGDDILFSM
jgi:hypothetical protein